MLILFSPDKEAPQTPLCLSGACEAKTQLHHFLLFFFFVPVGLWQQRYYSI